MTTAGDHTHQGGRGQTRLVHRHQPNQNTHTHTLTRKTYRNGKYFAKVTIASSHHIIGTLHEFHKDTQHWHRYHRAASHYWRRVLVPHSWSQEKPPDRNGRQCDIELPHDNSLGIGWLEGWVVQAANSRRLPIQSLFAACNVGGCLSLLLPKKQQQ
jgi:hypothetical protein